MSLESRPYVGTWRLDNRELVQYTPDALVYINGDTSVPGCQKCNGRIDIQKFLTEVSVDAGTDPSSASASFTLSIPLHHTDSFARDAKFILVPGLEVHVYQRGYFPVKGLFRGLAEAPFAGELDVSGEALKKIGTDLPARGTFQGEKEVREKAQVTGFNSTSRGAPPSQIVIHESVTRTVEDTERTLQTKGLGVHYMVGMDGASYQYLDPVTRKTGHAHSKQLDGVNERSVAVEVVNGYYAKYAQDQSVIDTSWAHASRTGLGAGKKLYAVPPQAQMESLWCLVYNTAANTKVPLAFPAARGDQYRFGPQDQVTARSPGIIAHHNIPGGHADGAFPVLYMVLRSRGYSTDEAYQQAVTLASSKRNNVPLPPDKGGEAPYSCKTPSPRNPTNTVTPKHHHTHETEEDEDVAVRYEGVEVIEDPDPFQIPVADSLLDQQGLGGLGLENLLSYPYYHVFHGVVTQVGHAWSGGVNTVTVQCASMLHFWEYHKISTNASIFGARPSNSKLQTSMVGHNFTGMHPYQIMYTLHHDMAGAAAGVGWALSSKTNQSAVAEVAGDSLFSLNIKYWEQRFAQRMIKLRMHGATGELFSAAQSTFLGRNSSDSLTQLFRHRFSDASSRKGRAKEILEDSTSVGLFNKRKLEALLLSKNTNGNATSKGGAKFELNMAEMQAFVSNIGNWGQPAFFESAYESKLDIAQKVMEVTGFEFFQDVDGDFVFKPPMYNLDTSSSRIYRIEDIDLISISTDEKEPQATYVTVKGSQFQNLQGTGVENEWGVRGQYIDYRLVAQFGWRPSDYETAYFNDPKSMFFSAINRLDLLNAPSKAATVTIPLRPEIRPGYPVYIPYLDAYYYCNGFSHSYSVGGSCTTTLQLIAKRSKFYAPGQPGDGGIDDIDLSNTILPQRPLQVVDNNGHPRLSGFPNVVMALDPEAVNPLFWVIGAEIDRLDDPVVLKNILKMGSQKGIGVITDHDDGRYTMTIPGTQGEDGEQKPVTIEFFLGGDSRLPEDGRGTQGSQATNAVDVVQAGILYTKKKDAANKKIEAKQRDLVRLQSQLNSLTSQLAQTTDDAKRERLLSQKTSKALEIQETLKEAEGMREALEAELSQDDKTGVSQLQQLIKVVGERYFLKTGSDPRRVMDTHSLLDMLSDKKAVLTNGSQPGQYRYYSASHPDPTQQGQDIVEYSNPPDGQGPQIKRKNSFLDPEWQGTTVTGYLRSPQAAFPGMKAAEAELGQTRPSRGIRVLTSNPNRPTGEIIPTSQIRELMFSVQDVTQTKGSSDNQPDFKPTLSSGVQAALARRFTPKSTGREISLEDSVQQFYVGSWSRVFGDVILSIQAAAKKAVELEPERTMPFPEEIPLFPENLVMTKSVVLNTSSPLSLFKIQGSLGSVSLGGDWSSKSPQDLLSFLGEKLAQKAYTSVTSLRNSWVQRLDAAGYTDVHKEQICAEFSASLAAKWGVSVQGAVATKTLKKGALKRTIQSPVFPVSDQRGYEVVGTYRYGRDVDIEPGGVWDSLHAQDPLQFLDRKTVEDVLDAVVSGKPITVEEEQEIAGGRRTKVRQQLAGTEAVTEVERRALNQLRKNLTDRQIIDLGLAIPSDKDPNLLQLNLSNWFSDGTKEGIHKLPVNNAAFTLADLNDQQDGKICACKAAEAGLFLEAFQGEDFLQLAGNISPTNEGDPVTQFVANQMHLKSVPWKSRQDALRGVAMGRPEGSIISSLQDGARAVIEGAQGESQAQIRADANFKASVEAAKAAARKARGSL